MNPKKKIIIISIICVFVSLILIFFVVFPLIKEIKKDSENIAYLKKEQLSSQSQKTTFAGLKEFYNKVEPDFVKMDNLLIDSEVPIDLIKFLEKTAKDSNVSIDISTVNLKRVEPGLWNYMDFQIALSGSFSNFLRFVEKIESGPFLSEIISLSVGKSGLTENIKSSGKKVLDEVDANLSIKVFTK